MSKSEYFDNAYVQYPAKEEAMVYSDAEQTPFPYVVIGVTYPYAKYAIYKNMQKDNFTMEYIVEGCGEICAHGKWRHAVAGETYIQRDGEIHEYRANAENPWKKIWINFSTPYMSSMLDAYKIESGVYKADTSSYFETLLKLSKSGHAYAESRFVIADCVHRIVTAVASASRKKEETSLPRAIRDALVGEIYNKCKLDDVAARLYISKSHLERTFVKAYGITPYEFLLRSKIDAVRLLLENTNMGLKEIADYVGFSDEHYLSAVFTKRVGMRPGAYRKIKKP